MPKRLAALAATLLVLLAGCTSEFGGVHLRIAAGNRGGVYGSLAAPLAQAWADDLGVAPAQVQVLEPTAGSKENVDDIQADRADIAFVAADYAAEHSKGLAALARIHDDYLHVVVRANSDITRVGQLRGRRVAIGAAGSGVEYIAQRLFTVARLQTVHLQHIGDATTGAVGAETVRASNAGLDESVTALREGRIDAFLWSGGLPTPKIAEFNEKDTLNGHSILRLLDIAEEMPGMQAANQVYATATIPTSTYNQAGPVTTLVVPNFLVVRASMADDVAEVLCRGLFDAQPQLAQVNSAALSIDVHPGIETQPIPLHPGALRYYRAHKT